MYETFEHTADLGLRVRAIDLESLFVDAATALFATLVENMDAIEQKEQREIRVAGEEWDLLLFDWLNELLYYFDAEHMLFSRFQVRIERSTLIGQAWGEKLDPAKHILSHEVKAITYHGLNVEQKEDGWLAEFIVDI